MVVLLAVGAKLPKSRVVASAWLPMRIPPVPALISTPPVAADASIMIAAAPAALQVTSVAVAVPTDKPEA